MELETNTPTPDEARLLAQSKKLTLQPVHADVAADDVPDSVLVAQHLTQGPVGNIDIDTEQNIAPVSSVEATDEDLGERSSQLHIYVLTGIGLALLAAVIVLVIVQL